MLFPTVCPICSRRGPAPCPTCRSQLRPATGVTVPPGLTSCTALIRYEGAARRLVTGLKYCNQLSHLPWMGKAMAEAVGPDPADMVTWAPTSGRRLRLRGFDQARELARSVARELGLPSRAVLLRIDRSPQTGRSLPERLDPPRFTARRRVGGRVLLVDDVLTTGATLAAASRMLIGAGAAEVHGLVVAQTPLKSAVADTE